VTGEPPEDPDLRDLTGADLPALVALEQVCYTMPWQDRTFESLLERGDTDLLGAFRDGRLIGYVICWTIADQAEVGNLAVEPRSRRRGLAQRLLSAAVARARARGARECFLEVRESNVGAQALYRKNGFIQIGRRRGYYAQPAEDALVMRRRL
jgi:[ribosomal protein S18]-alanine N-acetyltransferase